MSTVRRSIAVFGAFAAMFATSPGQTFVVSNFTGAMGEELGLLPSKLAGAYLVGTLMSAGSLTHAGRLADRIGPRHMMGLGGIGVAVAGWALSHAAGFWSLCFGFYLLRFFGQGILSLSSSHALALRFDARLGTIEGLKGATFSSAIAIMPQVAVALVATHGWREALWMLTSGAAIVALVSAYALLDPDPPPRASAPGNGPAEEAGFTLPEARRQRSFWVLVASGAFTGTGLTAAHFHLQPILLENGMDETVAAATFVAFAAAGFVTTLAGGFLVDRMAPARILATGLGLLGAGMGLTGLAPVPLVAHGGMGLLGLGHGFVGAVVGTTLARYFGRAHHGAIRGASTTAVVAGAACGPYAVGLLAESVGGYSVAISILGLGALPLAVAAWFLREPDANLGP